jgi:hypothetical protein
MDEITVGPLQLCNIPDTQPGIGFGIKVKNGLPYHTNLYGTMKSLSWAFESLYTRDAQLHTDTQVKELIQLTFHSLYNHFF